MSQKSKAHVPVVLPTRPVVTLSSGLPSSPLVLAAKNGRLVCAAVVVLAALDRRTVVETVIATALFPFLKLLVEPTVGVELWLLTVMPFDRLVVIERSPSYERLVLRKKSSTVNTFGVFFFTSSRSSNSTILRLFRRDRVGWCAAANCLLEYKNGCDNDE